MGSNLFELRQGRNAFWSMGAGQRAQNTKETDGIAGKENR